MKLLIASDIHGSAYYTHRLMDVVQREQPQTVVLLGDIYNHGPRNPLPQQYEPLEVAKALNAIKDKLIVIKGNCDSQVDQMISEFLFVESAVVLQEGKEIFLTHGHVFNADNLPAIPEGSVLIYGHFHRVTDAFHDGIHVLNPGSLSLPKDGHRAYILIEGDEVRTVTLDGEVLSCGKL